MLFGESIYSLSRNKLALLHKRNIGFLFQNYFLLPDLTIKENILLKGTLAGMTQHALEDACKKWLEVLKLTHRSNAYPNTLSGGEQQRAGLIRAIIHSPALLLCDEPTGNLDNENRDLIIKMLLDLKERSEMGIIVVSHDPIFSDISDKTIHLT
jgi:putative ABC transport system ATP-binding protein